MEKKIRSGGRLGSKASSEPIEETSNSDPDSSNSLSQILALLFPLWVESILNLYFIYYCYISYLIYVSKNLIITSNLAGLQGAPLFPPRYWKSASIVLGIIPGCCLPPKIV